MNREIFSYNIDINKNAYLNWRTDRHDNAHNLYVLASDYADGAITLINCILVDNYDKKADALIMPIMYSIDQSIELFLKAIIREIEELEGNTISNYKTHDIDELLKTMVAHIKKKEVKTKGLEKHLKPVTSFISELYKQIKSTDEKGHTSLNIDFARYPISPDGSPHFYVESIENVVIDVENLNSRFTEIRDSLEGLYCMYEAERENQE